MFIKNLKISNASSVIRDINFHKGINLIVDETKTNDKKESGNNVGKTTILRLIDYCLGSDGKSIYKDTEFSDKNQSIIEKFLKTNNIIVALTLVDDLDQTKYKIVIERNFLQKKDKIAIINNEKYPKIKEGFSPKLKELIFDSADKKPTFRQIISKNIRDEKNKLLNTVKTLHPTTTQEEYEALYLFWLGINLDLDKKQELEQKRSIELRLQTKLKKTTSYSEIIQSLIVVEKDILNLNEKKDKMNINANYDLDLQELNNVKAKITQLSTELSHLELRKELILESKKNLEEEKTNIKTQDIKRFYEEAKRLIPNIQKTFEETITFHNQMVAEKIDYITKEIPQIEGKIINLNKNINKLLLDEKKLSEVLKKSNILIELETITIELNKLHENKGRLNEQKNQWEKCIEELKNIEDQIAVINKTIGSKDKIIQERITKFNEFFSDISNKLYGEKFILSSDKKENCYELNIGSIEGNLGTGKKKVQIIAFDLAYIQFAEYLNMKCLHFILHDQIENIHSNQINSLLTEIINEINCQYIVPVLRDKLPTDISIDSLKVITLSQSDKLFKQ